MVGWSVDNHGSGASAGGQQGLDLSVDSYESSALLGRHQSGDRQGSNVLSGGQRRPAAVYG